MRRRDPRDARPFARSFACVRARARANLVRRTPGCRKYFRVCSTSIAISSRSARPLPVTREPNTEKDGARARVHPCRRNGTIHTARPATMRRVVSACVVCTPSLPPPVPSPLSRRISREPLDGAYTVGSRYTRTRSPRRVTSRKADQPRAHAHTRVERSAEIQPAPPRDAASSISSIVCRFLSRGRGDARDKAFRVISGNVRGEISARSSGGSR